MKNVLSFGTCGNYSWYNGDRTHFKVQQFVTRRWICGIKGGI